MTLAERKGWIDLEYLPFDAAPDESKTLDALGVCHQRALAWATMPELVALADKGFRKRTPPFLKHLGIDGIRGESFDVIVPSFSKSKCPAQAAKLVKDSGKDLAVMGFREIQCDAPSKSWPLAAN
jgi:hypothetical protein